MTNHEICAREGCGKVFVPANGAEKYHDAACAKQARRANFHTGYRKKYEKTHPVLTKECHYCKKTFESRDRRRVFCLVCIPAGTTGLGRTVANAYRARAARRVFTLDRIRTLDKQIYMLISRRELLENELKAEDSSYEA